VFNRVPRGDFVSAEVIEKQEDVMINLPVKPHQPLKEKSHPPSKLFCLTNIN
jgi:hypothetical protein